jgi:ADP-heptose:LPS heptosyltransferase
MRARLARIWFLLSVVLPLLLRTRRRPVLFVRHGALGDIICTFPAALALKARHPGAAFVYSCHQDFADLPRMGGVTHRTTSVEFAEKSFWACFFGAIYHFRYGDDKADSVSTKTLIEEFCEQHQVPVTDVHPRLEVSASILNRMKELQAQFRTNHQPLIVFHTGPSWLVREWPLAAWSALAKEISTRTGAAVVQLGVDKHVERGVIVGSAIPEVRSLVNQLTLEETVAFISLASLVVGIDSGLLHIAAALRIPAVGVFGPTSPWLRFSPESSCSFIVSGVKCQGCHHRLPRLHWRTDCPYHIECMKTIDAGAVAQTCVVKLNAAASVRTVDL